MYVQYVCMHVCVAKVSCGAHCNTGMGTAKHEEGIGNEYEARSCCVREGYILCKCLYIPSHVHKNRRVRSLSTLCDEIYNIDAEVLFHDFFFSWVHKFEALMEFELQKMV